MFIAPRVGAHMEPQDSGQGLPGQMGTAKGKFISKLSGLIFDKMKFTQYMKGESGKRGYAHSLHELV